MLAAVARVPRVAVGNGSEISRNLQNAVSSSMISKQTVWFRFMADYKETGKAGRFTRDGSGSLPYTAKEKMGRKKEKRAVGGRST